MSKKDQNTQNKTEKDLHDPQTPSAPKRKKAQRTGICLSNSLIMAYHLERGHLFARSFPKNHDEIPNTNQQKKKGAMKKLLRSSSGRQTESQKENVLQEPIKDFIVRTFKGNIGKDSKLSKEEMWKRTCIENKERFAKARKEMEDIALQEDRDYFSRISTSKEEAEGSLSRKRAKDKALIQTVSTIYERDPNGERINQLINQNEQWRENALKDDDSYVDSLKEALPQILEESIIQRLDQDTIVLIGAQDKANYSEIAKEIGEIISDRFFSITWRKNFVKNFESNQ